MDMSTPLLPEVVPEIDANPVSFYRGGGRVWRLTRHSVPYVKFAQMDVALDSFKQILGT